MNKFFFRTFSEVIKVGQKKLTNLNSLVKIVSENFENLTKEDFISVFNKFQEMESKDPNAKLKLYDLLDYVIYDEKKISDNILLKTVMRVLLSVQLYDKIYWDYFKKLVIKNNLLFSTEYNYLDYLKIYSIVNYEDEELWKIFEEYFLESNRSFEIEDVQAIALCFGNNKKGSKQFWITIFDTFELKNQKYPDFILNFSVCLCGFLQSKKILKMDKKMIQYICIYLNFSTEFLYKRIIQGMSVEKIDVVYSLFNNFHKSYYIDQIHLEFPKYIESNLLKNLIESLEFFLKNYLDKNINRLEAEDFEQISKILKYSTDYKISFELLHPNIFVRIFINDIVNINNYSDIYNFLHYFEVNNIKEEKLKKVFSEDTVWEKFIEVMHLMSFDELINLTKIMKSYHIKYFRIWIFLQNFFRKNIKVLTDISISDLSKGKELVVKIEKILSIFNDPKIKCEEFVLLPFIVNLEKSLEKVNIINSHNEKFILINNDKNPIKH